MIKKIKIFGYDLTFVFRHKWDNTDDKFLKNVMFSDYNLGLWFKLNRVVGKKNFKKVNEWGNNLVKSYMVGIDLIVCKLWVEISKGAMVLNINTSELKDNNK